MVSGECVAVKGALIDTVRSFCINLYQQFGGLIMTAAVTADQTVQEWGNGLAVRITAPVAKAARFVLGLPIKVEVVEGGVFLRAVGKPKLTLAQKLKAFDPAIHGGEVMAGGRVGAKCSDDEYEQTVGAGSARDDLD